MSASLPGALRSNGDDSPRGAADGDCRSRPAEAETLTPSPAPPVDAAEFLKANPRMTEQQAEGSLASNVLGD
jgi:hypothetical protein